MWALKIRPEVNFRPRPELRPGIPTDSFNSPDEDASWTLEISSILLLLLPQDAKKAVRRARLRNFQSRSKMGYKWP
jgi:hypothetical protein